MGIINIKGLRIGEGRPKTIVSLMPRRSEDVATELGRLMPAGAQGINPDCVEWRADCLEWPGGSGSWGAESAKEVVRISRYLGAELICQPFIFTWRTKGQGGRADLSPDEYAALLRRVIEGGSPDFVDIELCIGDERVRKLADLARANGVRTIVSHHDFTGTPETSWMTECLLHMAQLGADVPKLAVMARCDEDAGRLMEATSRAAERLDAPLLTMAMGECGSVTRVSGEAFGSALTFCALGTSSAPGQVELSEAMRAMDALHEELATR